MNNHAYHYYLYITNSAIYIYIYQYYIDIRYVYSEPCIVHHITLNHITTSDYVMKASYPMAPMVPTNGPSVRP